MSRRVNFGITMFRPCGVMVACRRLRSPTPSRGKEWGWICDACQTYKYARAWRVFLFPSRRIMEDSCCVSVRGRRGLNDSETRRWWFLVDGFISFWRGSHCVYGGVRAPLWPSGRGRLPLASTPRLLLTLLFFRFLHRLFPGSFRRTMTGYDVHCAMCGWVGSAVTVQVIYETQAVMTMRNQ